MARITLVRFPRVVLIVAAVIAGLCITMSASADTPPGRGADHRPAPTATPTSAGCAVLVVHLNGAQPATQTCAPEAAEGLAAALPDYCGQTSLRLYQDRNYGGARICFTGRGIFNLTDVPYYHTPFPWIPPGTWSDRVSSFRTGMDYVNFYEHKDAVGARIRYAYYQSRYEMPSGWNDRVTSICIWGPDITCP